VGIVRKLFHESSEHPMRHDIDTDTQISRAVIRNGRLTITPRPMRLMATSTHAYADALREAGTVMCDLELDGYEEGERELTVRFVPAGSQTPDSLEAIREWAIMAGCRRIWLSDEVIDLTDGLLPHPDDLHASECPTCGVVPVEHTTIDDIARARTRGLRPRVCPVCATRVPERRSQARSSR